MTIFGANLNRCRRAASGVVAVLAANLLRDGRRRGRRGVVGLLTAVILTTAERQIDRALQRAAAIEGGVPIAEGLLLLELFLLHSGDRCAREVCR